MFQLKLVCPSCHRASPVAIDATTQRIPCTACTQGRLFPQVELEAARWFVADAQKQVGPFGLAQLQTLASTGQLAQTDLIWQPGTPNWLEAGSLSGLTFMAPLPLAAQTLPEDADILSITPSDPQEQGALALKGIKVRPQLTVTMGDFQIIKKLGAGGMGTVYLAHQRSQNRQVALKILAEHLLTDGSIVERFYREALMLASLQHPNIVQFCGFGEEKGLPFFAMEHVEGYSTAVVLKYLSAFTVADALLIVRTCALALAYAHVRNVIHRDIKPDNILITKLGKVKLADLGLAKTIEEDLGHTESGVTLGTPRYMAPEQYRNAKYADQRSDIYALGGVLYHFLTGELPFQQENPGALMLAKEQGSYRRVRALNPRVPARLDFLVDKMLVRDIRHRYQSYQDLLRDLDNLHLASSALSFNPTLVVPPQADASAYDLVEVLVVDDDFQNIYLTQQTLEENNIPSNLNVVQNGLEALAFVRRQGKFAKAPLPSLIILGASLHTHGSLDLLEEIRKTPALRGIPLVIFATAPDTTTLLQKHGFQTRLTVQTPHDLVQFDNIVKSACELFLTVAERPA